MCNLGKILPGLSVDVVEPVIESYPFGAVLKFDLEFTFNRQNVHY
jgi:hypothetical protein